VIRLSSVTKREERKR